MEGSKRCLGRVLMHSADEERSRATLRAREAASLALEMAGEKWGQLRQRGLEH